MPNRSLALILVAAIVISLGGTLMSLNRISHYGPTAFALGQVQIGLTTNMSCSVDSNVSFGSAGQRAYPINLSTESDNSAVGYNNCQTNAACYGLQINNTGNVNINLTYSSNVNGTQFLGQGPNDNETDFTTYIKNGTGQGAIEQGCRAGLPAGWSNVTINTTTICTNLTYADANDMMTMEFNVTIDPQTPSGTKNATITITCAQNG